MKKSDQPAKIVTAPVQPQRRQTPVVESTTQTVNPSEPQQHVPGQVEAVYQPPNPPTAIPAEGNNIASTYDRAHADTLPANDQPPVEKTFVSPPD